MHGIEAGGYTPPEERQFISPEEPRITKRDMKVRRSSGEIEEDWKLALLPPGEKYAIVTKSTGEGKELTKRLDKEAFEDFLRMNFPSRSEDMRVAIKAERKRLKMQAGGVSREVDKERQEKIQALLDIEGEAFMGGDFEKLRDYFNGRAKSLEQRYQAEDAAQEQRIRELMENFLNIVKKPKDRYERFDMAPEAISIEREMERILDGLRKGHDDLDELKEFVAILDRRIEEQKREAT